MYLLLYFLSRWSRWCSISWLPSAQFASSSPKTWDPLTTDSSCSSLFRYKRHLVATKERKLAKLNCNRWNIFSPPSKRSVCRRCRNVSQMAFPCSTPWMTWASKIRPWRKLFRKWRPLSTACTLTRCTATPPWSLRIPSVRRKPWWESIRVLFPVCGGAKRSPVEKPAERPLEYKARFCYPRIWISLIFPFYLHRLPFVGLQYVTFPWLFLPRIHTNTGGKKRRSWPLWLYVEVGRVMHANRLESWAEMYVPACSCVVKWWGMLCHSNWIKRLTCSPMGISPQLILNRVA